MLWISLVWTVVFGRCWLARCHQLTAEDRDEIVETHNHFRSLVWPGAANMRRMSWDDSLALVAAGYATKCVWEHNPDLGDLGENLYATSGPFNASKAITGWYLEHLDYSYHNDSCPEDKLCGHYTQVVWAETTLVGCSTHLCEKVVGLTFTGVTMLVCDYSPAGNVLGELPYEEGEPCSNCPEDLQHCEKNICVAESPAVTEGTAGDPPPGTDSPSPSEHSTTESPSREADESAAPTDAGRPHSDTSSPPLSDDDESEENGEREEDMEVEVESERSVDGGMSLCSSALLLATLLLLTL
ncbi:peptidase inhibitor 16-like [Anguilla anguilla]|uniref:peptidase inhibitor 16-like n=1 Tax=Anguilla anguilla TaxID=7936 RepID=UPI0015B2852D|nr:peptidase inhibitor 16-like [Anguilla anguilla]